ncbi:GAF and ANTAR domain-containing protein [Amycolatopsis mongoliensis]|uniref:GAF and ANTAR domain-containing protein n=1 Tax=Amycolatopsis mongoliensis TaxID=715475 RepID=A0A9Y2JJ52_9PSEU|nr:GAF and ANTAR domain-containing protein [Amycolatopsis sp. 4-36]WIX98341.1 GAF and ANTAR domain-containing protein [Amycolatopsis sp. 4-36]
MDRKRRDRLWRSVTDLVDLHRCFSGWAGVVCRVAVAETGVDAAAISIRTRAREFATASDAWAESLEAAQHSAGDGPGTEAHNAGSPVLVSDFAGEGYRWPGFADAVAGHGLGAVFAFPLRAGGARLGALGLYRRSPGGLAAAELADAAVLTELATAASLTDSHDGAPNWATEDLDSHNDDVHVATGVLAARLKISVEAALTRLRAHAFSHRRPLPDVAHDIVEHRLHPDSVRE